ncbi:ABC transporter substrate-binding protein [Frankia sp. ACN1ag]|uniref:ABC transporter substrate-binding protein n=1 Tax=Frankia sp. ACN1ag TaxID=102891 RepID=UPI0006DCA0C3|nr:ABC transporter substrate-binding protein [Frankia sp. ACN1ag]KQC38198.1 branched-chain amino acid ABC transporter substrate-binding protein [Frankia sp. ACN1ag]
MASRRRRTLSGCIAAFAALLLTVSACGGSSDGGAKADAPPAAATAAPTGTPLKIGNVGLYSGAFGPQNQRGLDALVAWSKWVNAHGGIAGHPVEVISRDDQGDPTKSIAAVHQLVEQDKVLALVGNFAGATDGSWRSYVEQHNIPVIGGITTTAQYGKSPMFFAATSNSLEYLTGEVYSVKLAGSPKFGTIVCAEQAACAEANGLISGISARLGISSAGVQTASASAPNYTSQCLSLRSAGVKAVITNVPAQVTARLIKDCSTQRYQPTYVFSGGVFQPNLIQPASEGAWLTSGAPLWFGDKPYLADFTAALKQYTKNDPDGFASRGWQAGLFFAAAAKNVSATPTSAEILDGLYALNGQSLGEWSPPLTFAKGQPNKVGACNWYAKVVGGKLTTPKGDKPVCVEN